MRARASQRPGTGEGCSAMPSSSKKGRATASSAADSASSISMAAGSPSATSSMPTCQLHSVTRPQPSVSSGAAMPSWRASSAAHGMQPSAAAMPSACASARSCGGERVLSSCVSVSARREAEQQGFEVGQPQGGQCRAACRGTAAGERDQQVTWGGSAIPYCPGMPLFISGCHNSAPMRLPYELQLGWRYTRAGRATRRNGFISFISGVSMLGIALGVAALIIVLR
jgi:hypothetical protein